MYTGSVLMIFKQYTLNGKRRVSNGKRHVIQRKQTRENVCGLCLNANSCRNSSKQKIFKSFLPPSCLEGRKLRKFRAKNKEFATLSMNSVFIWSDTNHRSWCFNQSDKSCLCFTITGYNFRLYRYVTRTNIPFFDH